MFWPVYVKKNNCLQNSVITTLLKLPVGQVISAPYIRVCGIAGEVGTAPPW